MAAFAWLTVRQAQEALKHGRLEEALRLIQQPHALEHRGAAALTTRLARAFTMRAERFLRKDDAEAAWRDLLQAEHLHSPEKNAERLRESLTRLGVAEVRALLQAGEPGRAEEAAARLRGKLVRTSELQVVEEAARGWLTALDLAARGEFTRRWKGWTGWSGWCAASRSWKSTVRPWSSDSRRSPGCWCGCTRRPTRAVGPT